ncbi:MAG: putative DNA-binding domain-containing protein [Rhizobacter sp.]|nr:putative DNA-binding domain-containing protein [Rhizobacter sp.]
MNAEAQRQQALIAALWGGGEMQGLAHSDTRIQRGLQAYQAHAGAAAERALAASFPTVQALVGEESFAALARVFWRQQPPTCGDLASYGEGLPAFIAISEQLRDVPYLADSARVDWLVAAAERAADASIDTDSLSLLAETPPSQLRLQLMPGTALLPSGHPIVSVWLAHRPGEGVAERREQARRALAHSEAETALVWRSRWRAQVQAISPDTARWVQCLLQGDTLAVALAEAGDGFAFEPWLLQALQSGWLWRALCVG